MGSPAGTYDRAFYDAMPGGTAPSARAILPIVLEALTPRSVVDVGCGAGTWLAACRELGVADVFGVDGPWVRPEQLQIPRELFRQADLGAPLALDRRFDLVLSLEVAEHLPVAAAAGFVESLIRCGPVILFSAAIPHQGGRHHLNEQWPEYWADLFARHGYVVADPVRRRVWNNPAVEPYYAQNVLLFCDPGALAAHPFLRAEASRAAGAPLARVHPRQYLAARDLRRRGLKTVLRALPALVRQAFLGVRA